MPKSLLDELTDRILDMPEDQRESVIAQARALTGDLKWIPNPGPQTSAYFSEAHETLYGGQAGGGKTDLLLGVALNNHTRSLILRRLNTEVGGLVDRLEQIVGGSNNISRGSPMRYRTSERIIDFGGCQNFKDREKYRGVPKDLICVAPETPVLMGDGSWLAISAIVPGDMVMTLEGPRTVKKSFPVRGRQGVTATFTLSDGSRVRQVQSASHRVLERAGWASHHTRTAASLARLVRFDKPIQSLRRHKSGGWLSRMFAGASLQLSAGTLCRRTTELFQSAVHAVRSVLDQWGWPANMAAQDRGSDCVAFDDGPQVLSRLQKYHHSQGPRSRLHLKGSSARRYSEYTYDAAYGHGTSSLADWMGRCWSSLRQYGGPLLDLGHSTAEAGGQRYPHQSFGAVLPSPTDLPDDGSAQIPKYTRPAECTYSHPYTMATRQSRLSLVPCAWSTSPVGVVDLHDIEVDEVNHFITQGGIVNKNCFDEVTSFMEAQYTFIIAWARTTLPGQRVRVVATANPPQNEEGMWVLRRWAAWLDPHHLNPALPGELRWYTTLDGKDTEITNYSGSGVALDDDGNPLLDDEGKQVTPMSRTFIPAELTDNPDLSDTGYAATLAGLPEELRRTLRGGDFTSSVTDDEFQVFKGAHIDAAMARWNPNGKNNGQMTALGADIAQGGSDNTVLAPRYGVWFDHLRVVPGVQTPDGPAVAALIFNTMRNGCEVILDVGGGYGGDTNTQLRQNTMGDDGIPGISPTLFNGAESAEGLSDRTGKLKFYNMRAAAYWFLREALDPEYGSFIALPPDRDLRAELVSIKWSVRGRGILIEDKAEIKKKIGRSPDRADAVVLSHFAKGKTNGIRVGSSALPRSAIVSDRRNRGPR